MGGIVPISDFDIERLSRIMGETMQKPKRRKQLKIASPCLDCQFWDECKIGKACVDYWNYMAVWNGRTPMKPAPRIPSEGIFKKLEE